jgi:hypothetical protein
MNPMNQHNNKFRSVTYTFLYSIPNGIQTNKKTLQERQYNQQELINKENIRLHNLVHFEKTKIPRVKSMNFNEITL